MEVLDCDGCDFCNFEEQTVERRVVHELMMYYKIMVVQTHKVVECSRCDCEWSL